MASSAVLSVGMGFFYYPYRHISVYLLIYYNKCIKYHLQDNILFNFLVVVGFLLSHKVVCFQHKHCLITECLK